MTSVTKTPVPSLIHEEFQLSRDKELAREEGIQLGASVALIGVSGFLALGLIFYVTIHSELALILSESIGGSLGIYAIKLTLYDATIAKVNAQACSLFLRPLEDLKESDKPHLKYVLETKAASLRELASGELALDEGTLLYVDPDKDLIYQAMRKRKSDSTGCGAYLNRLRTFAGLEKDQQLEMEKTV